MGRMELLTREGKQTWTLERRQEWWWGQTPTQEQTKEMRMASTLQGMLKLHTR